MNKDEAYFSILLWWMQIKLLIELDYRSFLLYYNVNKKNLSTEVASWRSKITIHTQAKNSILLPNQYMCSHVDIVLLFFLPITVWYLFVSFILQMITLVLNYDYIGFNFLMRDFVSIQCVYANETPNKEIKTNMVIFFSTHSMCMWVEQILFWIVILAPCLIS